MLRARPLLARSYPFIYMPFAIYFLRHGKPDLPFASYAETPFSVLCEMASGARDLGIKTDLSRELLQEGIAKNGAFPVGARVVMSPRRRAQETAELVRNEVHSAAPEVVVDLIELSFDLEKLYSPANGIDMDALNRAVLLAVETGEFAESLDHAFERVRHVFEKIQTYNQPVICITHDFFMRTIELFIRHHGDVTTVVPGELLTTQTNHPCTGFKTDSDFVTFVSWK